MSIVCAYEKSYNVYRPGSAFSFFKLPTNENRKNISKKHCGRPDMSESSRICDKHFNKKYFIIQSLKKTLISTALPKTYSKLICNCNEIQLDERCEEILNQTEKPKMNPSIEIPIEMATGDNMKINVDGSVANQSASVDRRMLKKGQIVNTLPTPNQSESQNQMQHMETLTALIASNDPSMQMESVPSIVLPKCSFSLVFVNGIKNDLAACTVCSKLEYLNELENHQCVAVELNDTSTLAIPNNDKLNNTLTMDNSNNVLGGHHKSDDEKKPKVNYQRDFIKNQLIFSFAEMFPYEGFNDTGFRKITSYLLQIGAKHGNIKVDDLLVDKKTLENERQCLVYMVKVFLKKIVAEEKLVFSCDMWNDPNRSKRCITLSCHFIDEQFSLQQSVLGTKIYDERKFDGDRVIDYMTDILGEYTSTPSTILSNSTIVTSKTLDFLQSFQYYGRMNCMCSLLNEVANQTLISPFLDMPKVCIEIIKRLMKQLPNQTYSFAIANYQLNNWHSIYELFDAYHQFITTNQCGKNFINNYEIIHSFLIEFQKASKLLSSNEEATISTVYLVKQKLLDVMRLCNIGSLKYPKVKEAITESLRNNFEITDIHLITLFLDPRYKSLKFLTKPETDKLHGTVREIIGEIFMPDDNLKKLKQLGDHVYRVDANGEAEVDNYLQLNGISPDTNVLQFWKQRIDFPKLRNLAKEMLCIPATSSAWECYFNKDKFKLSRRRLQLDLSELDTTLLLNGHSRYGLFDDQLKVLFES